MFFMRSLSAAAPKTSRPRAAEGRSPRRRSAAFRLETLESRDLMTTIPGVENHYGMLSIQASQYSHNSTSISTNGDRLVVTHNGQTATFSTSEVYSVNYVGGWGGYDTLVNDTNLYASMTGMGGNNNFKGGSGFNCVYMVGDFNTYDSRGGTSYVFSYNGWNSNIYGSNNYVYSYYY